MYNENYVTQYHLCREVCFAGLQRYSPSGIHVTVYSSQSIRCDDRRRSIISRRRQLTNNFVIVVSSLSAHKNVAKNGEVCTQQVSSQYYQERFSLVKLASTTKFLPTF